MAVSIFVFLPVMLVIAGLVIAGIVTLQHGLTHGRILRAVDPNAQQKMRISPKSALHEPGICQCDDALAYHRGSGPCQVPGCPCQQFIPSDLDPEEMKDVANATVTKLAIEAVNVRIDLETKTKHLEAATADRVLRQQLGDQRELGHVR